MAAFLYFLPGRRDVSRESVESAGITAVDDLSSVSFCETERGPDGGAGIIFAVEPKTEGGKLPKVGYYPKTQQWQSFNKGKYWIGYVQALPPFPADLRKTEVIDGHHAMLDDGNDWLIPIARVFGTGSALPQSLILGPDGELVMEAMPAFAKLSAQADRVFSAFLDGGEDLTLQECWDIALSALQQNYRLSGPEVSLLRLLNTTNVQTVLGNLIDLPAIMEAVNNQKKSQDDSNNLSDGEAA